MKRICAWCGDVIDEASAANEVRSIILEHGICAQCASILLSDNGYYLTAFLDGVDVPVIVIDSDARVLTANKQAREALHKDQKSIQGFRRGEVFECANAKLPGGCGNTVHCSGCTVHRTVMDTAETGRSHLRTPAYLHHGTPENFRRVDYFISTEKVGGAVLLRIDKATPDRLLVSEILKVP
jgi:PAS domain-containing protein